MHEFVLNHLIARVFGLAKTGEPRFRTKVRQISDLQLNNFCI